MENAFRKKRKIDKKEEKLKKMKNAEFYSRFS
jgi:hypothetical protein